MEMIFLTYINRSGSTYLVNLLSSSADIIAFPEAEILVSLFLENPSGRYYPAGKRQLEYLESILKNDPKLKHWGLDTEVIHPGPAAVTNFDHFIRILTMYRDKIKPGASVFLFKAERLIHLIAKIRNVPAKPKINFIAMMRDPRAVYASQKRTLSPLDGKPFSAGPVNTAIQWRQYAGICRNNENLPGFNLVRFEDLILSGVEIMADLCVRLGLAPSDIKPGSGDMYKRIPADHKMIHENILQGPIYGKTDEWKKQLTDKEIRLIEQTAGKMMTFYRYQQMYTVKDPYITGLRTIKEIDYFVNKFVEKMLFHLRPAR
jgi:hypothetical protein